MDADYTNPHPSRGERDRAWIRELIDKLVELEADNRSYRDKIKVMSAENTQLRNNVLDDPNLRQAFLEAAHKDHKALVDRHAKSVEQYNSIIDQHLAVNADLKAEVERYKFTLEEERQIARQDWAGLRCEHDRVKRALEQAEAEVERWDFIHRMDTLAIRKQKEEIERLKSVLASKDVQGSPQE